jgi:hypothetical protein
MSEVIDIQEARYSRAAARSPVPTTIGATTGAAASRDSGQLSIVKEEVRRSILLLDLTAQHARLLVKEISDPSRRRNFEAQITTIEQQLQVARQLGSNL